MIRRFLPAWARDKGISSQRELVLALLPYLEWCSHQDLKLRFEIILPHTEKKCGRNSRLTDSLWRLRKEGLIETRHEDTPQTTRPELRPNPYTSHRRVVKSAPRTHISDSLLSGAYGLNSLKPKAKKKKPKTSVKNLTFDDLRYIQSNKLGMSGPQLAEMFQITNNMVYKIRRGHVPAHLRP